MLRRSKKINIVKDLEYSKSLTLLDIELSNTSKLKVTLNYSSVSGEIKNQRRYIYNLNIIFVNNNVINNEVVTYDEKVFSKSEDYDVSTMVLDDIYGLIRYFLEIECDFYDYDINKLKITL